MTPLQNQAIDKAKQCINTASQFFNHSFKMPVIRFDQRGKSAGTARLQTWEIRLNPILLEENKKSFIDEVVPHEIAHLITFKLYGRVRPHGKEWQGVMNSVFQLPANTTHQFDVSSVSGKTFRYRCQCSSYELTVRRHNKMRRQQATYQCKQCRQSLTYSPMLSHNEH